MTFVEFAGWVPTIIIPSATLIQLIAIIKQKSSQGVSWAAWLLFGIANTGLYIYTEKYAAIQSIVGLLGSAILDFVIVGLVLFKYRSN